MTLPRVLLAVLVLTALTAFGGGVRWAVEGEELRPLVASDSAPGPIGIGDAKALAVLRAWDGRRAAAWSRGDAPALRRLYAERSTAGRRDVAMLRAWTGRGLRVRGIRMQVLAVRVRVHTRDRIVLDVTDRLARAVAVGRGVRMVLPRDNASTRAVTLRRVAGDWRVSSVRPQASPAASTAVTSRSWKS